VLSAEPEPTPGKVDEVVVPATYTSPAPLTAMARAASKALPPRNVAEIIELRLEFNFVTNPSWAPPNVLSADPESTQGSLMTVSCLPHTHYPCCQSAMA
jgi:hypothetical protein